jgi:hypothetical protein
MAKSDSEQNTASENMAYVGPDTAQRQRLDTAQRQRNVTLHLQARDSSDPVGTSCLRLPFDKTASLWQTYSNL